jgi:hypothetical protein
MYSLIILCTYKESFERKLREAFYVVVDESEQRLEINVVLFLRLVELLPAPAETI